MLISSIQPLSLQERVEAVKKVVAFTEGRMSKEELNEIYTKEEQLKAAIVFSREYIKETKISNAQVSLWYFNLIRINIIYKNKSFMIDQLFM